MGNYKGAAKDRERKLLRAVDSVLNQTFHNWELLIVADGCQRTKELVFDNYRDRRIKLLLIEKQPLWSGIPRNVGKFKATGENICYLDTDDYFGANHLKIIDDNLPPELAWVWFNDFRWNAASKQWRENFCHIDKAGKHGTANICFRRSLNVGWEVKGNYLHDYYFVRELRQVMPYEKIPTPEYYVCHIPNGINFKGYDI
jgi:glycosyltransferase involved in cell wall biosynthesis